MEQGKVLINEQEAGSITVSPAVFDALRHESLLRPVGVNVGTGPQGVGTQEWTTYGYDNGESITCWLVAGERIFSVKD
jgi:hypothetical protein